MKKSGRPLKAFALYAVFFGVTLLVETTLLIYLKAYEYFPKVFPNDQDMDSLCGNIFSQTSIACTGLMVALFNMNLLWQLGIVAAYFVVEALFLALGVYEHHWYRIWITSAGLLPLFWFYKRMYRKYYGAYGLAFELLCKFLAFFALDIVLINWGCFIATGIMIFNRSLLPDPNMSWVTVGFPVGAFLFFMVNWAQRSKRLVWKAALLLFCFGAYWAFFRFGVIYVKPGWFLPYTAATIAAAYGVMAFLGRHIRANAQSACTGGASGT